MKFNEITKDNLGDKFRALCKVTQIRTTSGPTLFTITDGTKQITATKFAGFQKRAFPEITEGDVIKAELFIRQRNDDIELEIMRYETAEKLDIRNFQNSYEHQTQEKADVDTSRKLFLDIPQLQELKKELIDVAEKIRVAIHKQQPIIIRHDNDTDGIGAGIAIERAIKTYLKNEYPRQDHKRKVQRQLNMAPYYNLGDMVRDIGSMKFNPKPLIIILDNGAKDVNLAAFKILQAYDIQVIVIDHHIMSEIVTKNIDNHMLTFVNPHLKGLPSDLNTGILATEVAKLIARDTPDIDFIPALTAIMDYSNEAIQAACLAKTTYTREELQNIGATIDYLVFNTKGYADEFVFTELVAPKNKKQEAIMSVTLPVVQKKQRQIVAIAKHYIEKKEYPTFQVIKVPLEKMSSHGDYPIPRKITSYIHHGLGKGPTVTMGIADFYIIFRADQMENFSIADVIKYVQEQVPHAVAQGGGHPAAGTMRFLPGAQEQVLEAIERFFQNI